MTRIPVDKLPQPRSFDGLREQNETLRQSLRWAEERIRKLEGELIAATSKGNYPPGWRAGPDHVVHYTHDGHEAICGCHYLDGAAEDFLSLNCGELVCIECLIQVDQSKIGWDRS